MSCTTALSNNLNSAPSAPNPSEDAVSQSSYGELVGLWVKNLPNFGGLLRVSDDGGGKLSGTEFLAPKYRNVYEPLRPNLSFCVDDGEVAAAAGRSFAQQQCCGSYSGPQFVVPHACEINFSPDATGLVTEFRTKCTAPHQHQLSLQDVLAQEVGQCPDDEFRIKMNQKLAALFSYMQGECHYTRLEWPLSPGPGAIIQPGLFKGDFDADGVELVMISYEDSGIRVKGIKITGDMCIPARQLAFKVDLTEAVVIMDPSQQRSIEDLRVVPVLSAPPAPTMLSSLPVQPFAMPDGVEDCPHQVPNTCKARFFGLAQIAYEGFVDPVFVSGHWVVFNEDLMGFLYFDLASFTLFHRVANNLLLN